MSSIDAAFVESGDSKATGGGGESIHRRVRVIGSHGRRCLLVEYTGPYHNSNVTEKTIEVGEQNMSLYEYHEEFELIDLRREGKEFIWTVTGCDAYNQVTKQSCPATFVVYHHESKRGGRIREFPSIDKYL